MVWPRRGRAQPQIEIECRWDGHLFLKPLNDLDAVVKAVRVIEFLSGSRVLESPRTVCPHVDFPHRTNRAGHEDFLYGTPLG